MKKTMKAMVRPVNCCFDNLDLIATTHPRATLPDLSVESSEIKDEVGINDPISPAQSPEDLKTPVENDDSKEKEAIEISDEDEEDEDGPTAEDEYRVEKILNHRIVVKENVLYQVYTQTNYVS